MDFLAMGEYGAYVWSSFALGFTVLLICALQGRRRHRKVLNEIRVRIAASDPANRR